MKLAFSPARVGEIAVRETYNRKMIIAPRTVAKLASTSQVSSEALGCRHLWTGRRLKIPIFLWLIGLTVFRLRIPGSLIACDIRAEKLIK